MPPWSALDTTAITASPDDYCLATRFGSSVALTTSTLAVAAPGWLFPDTFLDCSDSFSSDLNCADRRYEPSQSSASPTPTPTPGEAVGSIGGIFMFHRRSTSSPECADVVSHHPLYCWDYSFALEAPAITFGDLEAAGIPTQGYTSTVYLVYGGSMSIGSEFVYSIATIEESGGSIVHGHVELLHHLNGTLAHYAFKTHEYLKSVQDGQYRQLAYSIERDATPEELERWGGDDAEMRNVVEIATILAPGMAGLLCGQTPIDYCCLTNIYLVDTRRLLYVS